MIRYPSVTDAPSVSRMISSAAAADSGAAAQIARASSNAAGIRPSRGTTRFTRPQRAASAAPMRRPVSSHSTAIGRGSRDARRSSPPASGTRPSVTSVSANSACSAATTRSAARTSSKPPPRASPLTAAMTGLPRSKNSVRPANPPGPWSASMPSPAAAAFRSQPALKNRSPAPVRIAARSAGSERSESNAAYSARLVGTSIALALGRSRVMTRTGPSARTSTGTAITLRRDAAGTGR
jgi:hypothetical protein